MDMRAIYLFYELVLSPYINSVVPYYVSVAPLLLLLHPCNPHIVNIFPLHYYC